MLEMLVSSRIRRTLLEHLLKHPRDRFYLRGLAKELSLPISPLRRELKRLEHSGMLSSDQEANILFYTVNETSPSYRQLQKLSPSQPNQQILKTEDIKPVSRVTSEVIAAQGPKTVEQVAPKVDTKKVNPRALPVGIISAPSEPSLWRAPLRTPMMLGIVTVWMTLMLLWAGLFYLSMTNRDGSKVDRRADLIAQEGNTSGKSASGVMQSNRWRIMPGSTSAFSSGSVQETY